MIFGKVVLVDTDEKKGSFRFVNEYVFIHDEALGNNKQKTEISENFRNCLTQLILTNELPVDNALQLIHLLTFGECWAYYSEPTRCFLRTINFVQS